MLFLSSPRVRDVLASLMDETTIKIDDIAMKLNETQIHIDEIAMKVDGTNKQKL